MKIKSLFITLGLALAVGLGVGAGLSANNEVKKAKAVTYDYDVYVDIEATSNYGSGVWCHNFEGGTGTTWPGTKMTLISGNLYGVNLNAGNTKCIFNNGNNGKQTDTLDVESHKVFVMDNDTGGGWQDLDEYFPNTHNIPSSNTMRIFVNNSDLTNWTNSSETRVRCWGSASYTYVGAVYDLTWFENNGTGASGQWYGYADVPTDITGFSVVRCNPDSGRRVWDYAGTIEGASLSGAVAARVYKIQEYGTTYSYSATVGDTAPGVPLLSAIIEAYDTCSSSNKNGWGAYSALNTNFFANATELALNHEIQSLSGEKTALTKKISEHIAGLAAGAGAGSRPSSSIANYNLFENNNGDSTTLIIIVISATALVALGGYFVIHRRKEN